MDPFIFPLTAVRFQNNIIEATLYFCGFILDGLIIINHNKRVEGKWKATPEILLFQLKPLPSC